MTEDDFARQALYVSLRRAANVYRTAADAVPGAGRKRQLAEMAVQRDDAAAALAEAYGDMIDDLGPAEQDGDDASRRARSSTLKALFELLEQHERQLVELVEEMPSAAIDADRRTSLRAMLVAGLATILGAIRGLEADYRPRSEYLQRGLAFGRGPTASTPGPQRLVEVWFGTNRKPVVRSDKVVGFGSERADHVVLGRCEVSIPHAHAIGSVGSKWWKRLSRGDDRLQLARIENLGADAYWALIAAQLQADAEPDDAVVFLHGFNVDFEEAAIRAGQLAADLSIPGIMAFFSWPSRGRLIAYPADEATIDASEPMITDYLTDFAEKSGAKAVHIIAHSMGNRALLRAVDRIAGRASARSGKPFGQIILAAPDVDSGTFRNLAAAYAATAERTTLYASNGDRAVWGSHLLHGYSRIGYTPPVSVIDGIDTIQVTGLDMTWLGHGYVANAREVITDMYSLIVHGAGPDRRPTLRRVEDDGPVYWRFAS